MTTSEQSPIVADIAALRMSGIARIAAEGFGDPEVIPLWFGESDIVTPDFIRDAAKNALDDGQTFYNYARGHKVLRDALKVYHDRLYGLDLEPDRITVPGSTMATVMIAGQCLLRPGDEIVLVGPYWPNIESVARVIGATSIKVRLTEEASGWSLDREALTAAITPRTKAIYVNSPSNPTGWVMKRDEQVWLLDLCRTHGLGLIADEVYHRNVYDGTLLAPSFLTLAGPDEPVFVLNGFSKGWAMTGWRLGWMICPVSMVEPMAVLAEVNNTGATAFAQYGGVAALEQGEPFIAEFVARCQANRDIVMCVLGAHPRVRLSLPEGAFYAFPKIEGLADGVAFARACLKEKVGLAPGYTFGPGNEAHLRLCFAQSPARLEEALNRVCGVLDRMD